MAQKKDSMNVDGIKVQLYTRKEADYISLTDMARSSNQSTDVVIQSWMRSADTIEFLTLWEGLHNPKFKPLDFAGFNARPGQNRFFISPKQWIAKTGAIGIESKAGRGGGTFAHSDIALEFGTWLSPKFKIYLIKEFIHFPFGVTH